MSSPEEAVIWIRNELVQKILDKMQLGSGSAVEDIEAKQLEGNKDNWASVMFSLKFRVQLPQKKQQIDLVLKLMDESETVRHTMQSDKQFSNEIFTYATFAPLVISHIKNSTLKQKIESLLPKCYYASFSDNSSPPKMSDGVLALENLKPLGFKLGNRESLDFEHLSLAVDCLGSFHALSYFMKERHKDELFAKIVPRMQETMFVHEEEVRVCYGIVNARALQALKKYFPEEVKGLQRLTEETRDPFAVLTKIVTPKEPLAVVNHGDFLRNNVLFRYDSSGKPDAMKMLDFQTVRYASPAIDLSLILWMNSTHDVRMEHWNTLLQKYHRSVVNTLAELLEEDISRVEKRYSFDAFMDDFRKHSLHGYFISVDFLPWMLVGEDELAELVALWREDVMSQAHLDKRMVVGGERIDKELAVVAKDFIDLIFV